MLSRNETVLWRRLEQLEAKVQALEECMDALEARGRAPLKERRHYGR